MAEVFYLYILRSANNKLYVGQTNTLEKRINYHRWGVAARFTAQNHGPYTLVYTEGFNSRLKAIRREKQLKGWTRAKKEALIVGDLELLKTL